MDEKRTIKDWNEEERPREKLLAKGAKMLKHEELLAILLGSGNDKQNAVELAKEILDDSNYDFDLLAEREVPYLIDKFRGVGEAKAITIVAAMELIQRRKFKPPVRNQITGAENASKHMAQHFCGLEHEEFWVIYLKHDHKIIRKECLCQGGMAHAQIDLRILFQKALQHKAAAMIICHNHPTGSLEPSREDISLTDRIAKAAKIIGIRLVDHLVCYNKEYYSFAENGLL